MRWTSLLLRVAGIVATAMVVPVPVANMASAATTSSQVLATGHVVELTQPTVPLTTPVDGRLRGPDFSARVTGVAWPAAAGIEPSPYVAGNGHRLVVFSL